MLEMLKSDPASLSSVTDVSKAREVHLADSLSGLTVEAVANAGMIGDIGSGAGFPGVPLAVALPDARVEMIESVKKKTDFIDRVIAELDLPNASTINSRTEDWGAVGEEGRERYDVITARAVADLATLAELASPLLKEGGALVAWKGEREPESEARLAGIEAKVAMRLDDVETIRPYRDSRDRHFYVVIKTGPTPPKLPRRAGMARKRPLEP